ncbi:DUF6062 family protein [Thermotoga caldifontis]|uniref:DUF6062 family protein n=1 Tax=Thermotoga caldifontis TaxID=1508419 RepID=UPI00059760D3|nr:DUF6062 family protein [Thermotoga caldifontis]
MGLVEISLKDAIVESRFSCPICSLVDRALDSCVDNLLYELVNDVAVRSQLRSEGLCRRHVERIESYLSRHLELGSMGLAIIYADMLDHLIESMAHNFKVEREWGCFLCEKEKSFEAMYLKAFVRNIDQLLEPYRLSEALLCFDHYAFIAAKVKDPSVTVLKETQLSKFKRVAGLLNSFVSKHDYRNTEGFTPEEIQARKAAGILMAKNFHHWRRSR